MIKKELFDKYEEVSEKFETEGVKISKNLDKILKKELYIGIIILIFFICWAEMAVGIFNTPFAGN